MNMYAGGEQMVNHAQKQQEFMGTLKKAAAIALVGAAAAGALYFGYQLKTNPQTMEKCWKALNQASSVISTVHTTAKMSAMPYVVGKAAYEKLREKRACPTSVPYRRNTLEQSKSFTMPTLHENSAEVHKEHHQRLRICVATMSEQARDRLHTFLQTALEEKLKVNVMKTVLKHHGLYEDLQKLEAYGEKKPIAPIQDDLRACVATMSERGQDQLSQILSTEKEEKLRVELMKTVLKHYGLHEDLQKLEAYVEKKEIIPTQITLLNTCVERLRSTGHDVPMTVVDTKRDVLALGKHLLGKKDLEGFDELGLAVCISRMSNAIQDQLKPILKNENIDVEKKIKTIEPILKNVGSTKDNELLGKWKDGVILLQEILEQPENDQYENVTRCGSSSDNIPRREQPSLTTDPRRRQSRLQTACYDDLD